MRALIVIPIIAFGLHAAAKPKAVPKQAVKLAASRTPANLTGMQVFLLDTISDVNKARQVYPGAQVYSLAEAENLRRRVVLPIDRQSEFFRQAGLSKSVQGMDQFDKDMLVRRLRYNDAKTVHAKFKQVSVADCTRAQALLKNFH